jgi:hypothetical protein
MKLSPPDDERDYDSESDPETDDSEASADDLRRADKTGVLSMMTVLVHPDDKRTTAIIKAMGVNVGPSRSASPHELAAGLRSAHQLIVLGLATKNCMHVNVPWDRNRFTRLVPRYNEHADASGSAHLVLHDAEPINVTTRDLCAAPSPIDPVYHEHADAIFMDIYECGYLRAAEILALGSGIGYWSTNTFEGDFGGMSGGIAWRPVPHSLDRIEIATHPGASTVRTHRETWLYKETTFKTGVTLPDGSRAIRWLNVMALAAHQGRTIYKLVLTVCPPRLIEPLKPVNRFYNLMTLPGTNMGSSFSTLFSRTLRFRLPFTDRQLHSYPPAYSKMLGAGLSNPSPAATTVADRKFDDAVADDWEYQRLLKCLPEVAARLREETIICARYFRRTEKVDAMMEHAHINQGVDASLRSLFAANLPSPFDPATALKRLTVVTTAASGVLYLFQNRNAIGTYISAGIAALYRVPGLGPFLHKWAPAIATGSILALTELKTYLMSSPTMWLGLAVIAILVMYKAAKRYRLYDVLLGHYRKWTDDRENPDWQAVYNNHDHQTLDAQFENGTAKGINREILEPLSTAPQARPSGKPHDTKKKLSRSISGLSLHPDTDIGVTDPSESDSKLHILVATAGLTLFGAPKGSLRGVDVALRERTMLARPDGCDPEAWDDITREFINETMKSDETLEPVPIQEWVESISDPGKRRTLERHLQEIIDGQVPAGNLDPKTAAKLLKSHSMFSKRDEILFLKTAPDGTAPGTKDRLIVSTSLTAQVILQPWIRAADKRFKERMTEPFTIRGRSYHVTYASGMVNTDLDAWYLATEQRTLEQITSIIVMGDDSLVCVSNSSGHCWREVDYSQYDGTQTNAHIEAECHVLAALGVPREIVDYLHKNLGLPSQSRTRSGKASVQHNFKFKPEKGDHRRITGAPDTSLGNSIVNVLSLLIADQGNYTEAAWTRTGFIRGLDQQHQDVTRATFLRGSFHLMTDGSHRWLPLPSQIVKMGKINKKLPLPLTDLETRRFVYGMAKSYAIVPRATPIIGDFLRMYDRLGAPNDDPLVTAHISKNHAFKPLGTVELSVSVDRPAYLLWLRERYGLQEGAVNQFSAACATNDKVRVMLRDDHVTRRLVNTDYGGTVRNLENVARQS